MGLLGNDRWHGALFDGEWRPAGETIDVHEPATGEVLGHVGQVSAGDVAHAAEVAAEAQRDWAARPYDERAEVLRRAAVLFREHADEIQGWCVRETGAIPPKAGLETSIAVGECNEAAALASRSSGELLPTTKSHLSIARRRPIGVVGVIAPFNFPLILAIRSVAPALALGNAVVLKPDPRTAVTGGVAIARVFEEAGLPAGLLHLVPGGADVGEALVSDPHTGLISFTGSTRAGRSVADLATAHDTRTLLELGGNNALVVFDDADLDLAVSAGAFGSFMHQGQICMTTGRHLVHEGIRDQYVERLAATADHLPVGNPATDEVALGPLIDAGQRDRVHELVTASADAGATIAAGGTYEELFYRPTVLTATTTDTPAYADEVFGPVAPVLGFSDLDEAVALAGGTAYGLSLGVITSDLSKGVEIADRVRCGIVHLNDQTVADEPPAPFGGVGASGNGTRIGGPANLDAFTDLQWLTIAGRVPTYPF